MPVTRRRALSVRARFDIFKRDEFRCRYCGQATPDVVLEVDHIVPIADGGSDDAMNLVTSCWSCNRGKSDVPLSEILTAEDPHDKAVQLLERERQIREHDAALREVHARREADTEYLVEWWREFTGRNARTNDLRWLAWAVRRYAVEDIRSAMLIAIDKNRMSDFRYVAGVIRGQVEQGTVRATVEA